MESKYRSSKKLYWLFITFIPIVGYPALFIILSMPTKDNENTTSKDFNNENEEVRLLEIELEKKIKSLEED